MNISFFDPRVQRFLRGYDWRWQLALQLRVQPESATCGGDPLVRRAAEFLRGNRDRALPATGHLDAELCEIAIALAIERDWDKVRRLRLMVLAGLDGAEIAALVGAPGAIIELWEQIFFDARELRSAAAWIDQFLIWPAIEDRDPEHAQEIRLILAEGPAAIYALLDDACMTRS